MVQGSITLNLSFLHKHDPGNGRSLPSDTTFLSEFAENQKMQSAANPELAKKSILLACIAKKSSQDNLNLPVI